MWHGSIKPENFVLDSFNNMFLTDILPFSQVHFFNMADENSYNKYHGYLDDNKRCYLHPDRFLDEEEMKVSKNAPTSY